MCCLLLLLHFLHAEIDLRLLLRRERLELRGGRELLECRGGVQHDCGRVRALLSLLRLHLAFRRGREIRGALRRVLLLLLMLVVLVRIMVVARVLLLLSIHSSCSSFI